MISEFILQNGWGGIELGKSLPIYTIQRFRQALVKTAE
jgi:hypothetical protein